MHECGQIVYLRSNPMLKDCIILNPGWLASFVAPLFTWSKKQEVEQLDRNVSFFFFQKSKKSERLTWFLVYPGSVGVTTVDLAVSVGDKAVAIVFLGTIPSYSFLAGWQDIRLRLSSYGQYPKKKTPQHRPRFACTKKNPKGNGSRSFWPNFLGKTGKLNRYETYNLTTIDVPGLHAPSLVFGIEVSVPRAAPFWVEYEYIVPVNVGKRLPSFSQVRQGRVKLNWGGCSCEGRSEGWRLSWRRNVGTKGVNRDGVKNEGAGCWLLQGEAKGEGRWWRMEWRLVFIFFSRDTTVVLEVIYDWATEISISVHPNGSEIPSPFEVMMFSNLLFKINTFLSSYETLSASSIVILHGKKLSPSELFNHATESKKTDIVINGITVDLMHVIPDLLICEFKGDRFTYKELDLGYVEGRSEGEGWKMKDAGRKDEEEI